MTPDIVDSLGALSDAVFNEAGAVIVTEEALNGGLSQLSLALKAQAAWSDLPFVLLRARRPPGTTRRMELPPEAINVIELERPLSSTSLISAVESALRARAKQFVIRDQMVALEHSQAALRASEAELRLIADSLPVLIAFIDNDMVYRFVNLAYEAWMGRPVQDIVGRRIEDVIGPELWATRQPDIEVVLTGVPVTSEIRWPRPDGSRRDTEIRYIPRFGAAGTVDGFHVFAADITERNVALEYTRREAALLESRVAERTAELRAEMAARQASEEALRQAQKMEVVGQLTGGIAHDFNNMLTGILAAIELARSKIETGEPAGIPRLLDIATSSAQRAAGLTQRLLAFSRRQALDPKPVDVGALALSMEELLRRTLGERIQLKTTANGPLPSAMVDANQLESALLNLAINARDAMPDGGVLHVDTSVQALPDHAESNATDTMFVVLSVADTGVGMDEATLEKVFEPFFTTKPIGQGTGLGMSMIYGFVNQTGGHIRIRSVPGEGTTVRLYLPIAQVAAVEAEEARAQAVATGSGQQIVVVDDDPQVRSLVTELLASLGYDVHGASSAETALEYLQGHARVDLLVTDVGLPGLNGRQLADIARQARPGLRVLFMTGYAFGAVGPADFLDDGMTMIGKPFQLAELSRAVASMLGSG
nr:PAS domain-containing sensor histidine kinase [Luteibacter yeojuensis]